MSRKRYPMACACCGSRTNNSRGAFVKARCNRSSPRNCSHEALPFVEAPAKAKLACSIETQPGDHLAAFSAFRIIDVPIMTARKKDVRRKRVMFGFHCRKLGLNVTYRRGQALQCVLKASKQKC
jgi:hypothetical protein